MGCLRKVSSEHGLHALGLFLAVLGQVRGKGLLMEPAQLRHLPSPPTGHGQRFGVGESLHSTNFGTQSLMNNTRMLTQGPVIRF
jgi:hypothetical protein